MVVSARRMPRRAARRIAEGRAVTRAERVVGVCNDHSGREQLRRRVALRLRQLTPLRVEEGDRARPVEARVVGRYPVDRDAGKRSDVQREELGGAFGREPLGADRLTEIGLGRACATRCRRRRRRHRRRGSASSPNPNMRRRPTRPSGRPTRTGASASLRSLPRPCLRGHQWTTTYGRRRARPACGSRSWAVARCVTATLPADAVT